MRLVRTAALTTLVATVALASTACTSDDSSPDPAPAGDGDRVVASTTWAGALARAAGATDVTVIAPAIIPNQADFEPTADDLAPAGRADHVLYAESDGFAAQLKDAAGEAHLVPVKLSYGLADIRAQVTELGELLGTENAATQWLSAFDAEVTNLSASLQGVAPIPPFTAVAQVDVAHWATFAGVKVVASYGPAAVTADQRSALAASKPKLLLANVHLPAGTPDIPGAIRVDLANYPGEDLDLVAVFRTNAGRIGATFSK
jgi:zinc transport system substrate-binding protein